MSDGVARPAAESSPHIGEQDLFLFNEGTHCRLWECLGAHLGRVGGVSGTHFAVWAPSARQASVVGDFNGWDPRAHPLEAIGNSGIWHAFVAGVGRGAVYKYHLVSHNDGYRVDKADPYGFFHELPPKTASMVWSLDYEWNDQAWMRGRKAKNALEAPMSIYEVHLGSWQRDPSDPHRLLSYNEIAPRLADHVESLGFTHVELMPVMEHPFYGSWGYQVTGYFAPSARYGSPQDLMVLVDHLHQRGIGVILDWVPAHFPSDEHGLGYFDGTHLYEHADPKQGFHPDWRSLIYNYGRHEVRAFLISSANFWLDVYHVDGLRVDGVASMLYLDYSREDGEWIPNEYGGRENLDAISFVRELNETIYREHPDVQMIAEESTSWPAVSRPTYAGGLGFGLKWDMGWMHDTLAYMQHEPIHRKYHHDQLTFRGIYAFHENFCLPLSHDEVVHGKGSLLDKMPGDEWQKFANLRLLFAYMYATPGKKLLFMGAEIAQWREWAHDESLDWHLAGFDRHRGVQQLVGDLNRLYRGRPALHRLDVDPHGFTWIDGSDYEHSILVFARNEAGPDHDAAALHGPGPHHSPGATPHRGGPPAQIVCAFNFTPVPRHDYRVGVSRPGRWTELLNTDAEVYGGSGQGNFGGAEAEAVPWHGRDMSLRLTLPPLGAVWLASP